MTHTNVGTKNAWEYDHKDHVILSTAFQELREADVIGYRYGVGSFFVSYYFFEKNFKWRNSTKFFAAFASAVMTYNLYTHKSRQYYAHLASKFNQRVSIQLSSMMN